MYIIRALVNIRGNDQDCISLQSDRQVPEWVRYMVDKFQPTQVQSNEDTTQ